jgi:acyl-homoserine lactone acylase PvdQ
MLIRPIRLLVLACCAAACPAPSASDPDLARWERRARNVTIVRDDWGIPHVYGRTDADAVFGLMYAQAEDDFNRVETNYLNAMGRLAEAEGEGEIYRDLRMKLFIDPDSLKAWYQASPPWLVALMDAWADGLNFYLHQHPAVMPRVIRRFAPWMALSFTEGSIGGDIERISLPGLRAFYEQRPTDVAEAGSPPAAAPEPSGSNGIAIAPSNTVDGHALLLINPHTSFYFRAEAQVVSQEGLNAYGALTWGQFFVYQGFNETAGWMHTSSGVDNIDYYLETIVERPDGHAYRYGTEQRPVVTDTIAVPYRTDGGMAERRFTVYRTHHGPVVRAAGERWMTVRLMQNPVQALTQSYRRTKARSYREFREAMELHTNSSNNTVFADAEGNIAYFHSNFIPRRDPAFDWTRPVDGSDPRTEWQDVLSVDESPGLLNPPNGWLYNSNNWPYSAAGPHSPRKEDYPAYVESGGENPRGIHAIRVLQDRKDFTPAGLIAAAFDSYLPAFAELVPPLVAAYDRAPPGLRARLAEQVQLLRDWDYRWSAASVPTALAVFWADTLLQRVAPAATREGMSALQYATTRATAAQRLEALAAASDKLAAQFGTWQTPWGEINRFQRLTSHIVPTFNDSAPSSPVPFTSAVWGSLASFGARPGEGTAKWYGRSGNSFVAVVEFGDSVRAWAVMAGGQSGDPASPHFDDQIERYAAGNLRDVYFYRPQLEGHTERTYRPGQ